MATRLWVGGAFWAVTLSVFVCLIAFVGINSDAKAMSRDQCQQLTLAVNGVQNALLKSNKNL